MRDAFVYIMASQRNGTLYIGITSDLIRRVFEHKKGLVEGFTKRYNVKYLVYFEQYDSIVEAIKREKILKAWKRQWKLELIEKDNPEWLDLCEKIAV